MLGCSGGEPAGAHSTSWALRANRGVFCPGVVLRALPRGTAGDRSVRQDVVRLHVNAHPTPFPRPPQV